MIQDDKITFFSKHEKKYLYENYYVSTQGSIIRLEPDSPNTIKGLATLGLEVCLGIIIVGSNGKISLIHQLPSNNFTALITEFKLIGEDCKLYIGYNPNHTNEEDINKKKRALWQVLDQQKIYYRGSKLCPTPLGTIAIDRETKEVTMPNLKELSFTNHPHFEFREITMKINDFFKPSDPVLQYSGYVWADLPSLSENAKEMIEICKTELQEKNKIAFSNHVFHLALQEHKPGYFYETLNTHVQRVGWKEAQIFVQQMYGTILSYFDEKNKLEQTVIVENPTPI